MKTILALCLFVATAYAGVIPWTREGELEARREYQRYCTGNKDTGDDGDLTWHCKRANIQRKRVFNHRHVIRVPSSNKQQVVFIETPVDDYKHEVLVTGQIDANHKTKIYVVPAIDKQTVSVTDDVAVSSKSGKPAIFFLKDNPAESGLPNPGPYDYSAPEAGPEYA